MKKFNWGWGIVLVCAAFVLFISSLVYRASKEKVELVTDNYYEKELKFQDQIDQRKNATLLSEDISLSHNANEGAIAISYPSSIDCNSVSGRILFFKPDNEALDFEINAQCDENHLQLVNSGKMKSGWWNVKISWASAGTPYYFEQKLMVN